MQNLAGVGEAYANRIVSQELAAAGIRAVPHDPGREEVHATIGGALEIGGYEIRLIRRWAYWSAGVAKMPNQPEDKGPHLHVALAVALNDAPHIGSGTRYSGGAGRL